MSLDIRYLTNGEKEIFVVINKGVSPIHVSVVDKRSEIDKRICRYAPNEPQFCEPDFAFRFGVQETLYPSLAGRKCVRTDLKPHNPDRCIFEGCRYNLGKKAGYKCSYRL